MTKTPHFSLLAALLCHLALALPALGAETRVVTFSHKHATQWGESLYLTGDLPELGSGDVTRALRMVPGADHTWSLKVALPAGVDYRFSYTVRWNAAASLSSSTNARQIGSEQRARVPGTAALRRVRVRYLSGWSRVVLTHDGGAVALANVGGGRGGSERVWEGVVETRAQELSFELSDGAGGRDRAPGGARYRTRLSHLTLADGALHAGAPDLGALESKGRVIRYQGFESRVLGGRRDLFIYLPRGYSKTQKRYPVAYMHDGQNLFGPGAMFGGWRVEEALDQGIAAGRIQELVVIGVANTRNRMSEYMPEADGGAAGQYARFLTEELKPFVDRNLRTRPEREHTATIGSSLGGLVSLYLGWKRSDVFGKVGSLSGSYWLRSWIDNPGPAPRPLKVWLDSGNVGGSRFDSMEDTLRVRDQLLRGGYNLQGSVRHEVDYGASHNERYWRGRVGRVLEFLFPAE